MGLDTIITSSRVFLRYLALSECVNARLLVWRGRG